MLGAGVPGGLEGREGLMAKRGRVTYHNGGKPPANKQYVGGPKKDRSKSDPEYLKGFGSRPKKVKEEQA